MSKPEHVAIIGAGPAGLTAAYLLSKENVKVTVLESHPHLVGGISRTEEYKGFRFDIGGHRFFSKSEEVNQLWDEILDEEFLLRDRSSRIYYKQKFFSYPLKAFEALWKLGVLESVLCVLSYFKARVSPIKNVKSFEDWITNQFGERLYKTFFKTYTEKVWGMKCSEISADWAAQRIKGLSLWMAIWNALPKWKSKNTGSQQIKTLIDKFHYPSLGPGLMWEHARNKIIKNGGSVVMNAQVNQLIFGKDHTWTLKYKQGAEEKTLTASHVISSAAIQEMIPSISPLPQSAPDARRLKYRDFITVALILKADDLFSDNWIYIHEPGVLVGRIQNYRSWSPAMVPTPEHACIGLEYFCHKGDNLWNSQDSELVALAIKEVEKLGLVKAEQVVEGCVVRQPKAYPVYDSEYESLVNKIRIDIESNYPRFYFVGRNGMHKYNNQDHAMMTAILSVKNILAAKNLYNVWQVNQDAEYHEEDTSKSSDTFERLVPRETKS